MRRSSWQPAPSLGKDPRQILDALLGINKTEQNGKRLDGIQIQWTVVSDELLIILATWQATMERFLLKEFMNCNVLWSDSDLPLATEVTASGHSPQQKPA